MLIRVDDWSTLSGRQIELRLDGRPVCAGIVGEVLAGGTVLLIQPFTGARTAFDKHDAYEAWAPLAGVGPALSRPRRAAGTRA